MPEQTYSLKIGVVDDEREIRRSIIQKIQALEPGASLYDAGFGAPALRELLAIKPDAAFLDIQMPGMDGLELLQELKAANPWMRVIMLSAYDEFEYAARALRFGAYDFLLKPADRKHLGQLLSNLKHEISHDYLGHIRPHHKQLMREGLQLSRMEFANLHAWHDPAIPKQVHITGPQQTAVNNLPDQLLFKCRINQEAVCTVVYGPEGTFSDFEQFVPAFKEEWDRWQEERFFEDKQPRSPGLDIPALKNNRHWPALILNAAKTAELDALDPLLGEWLDAISLGGLSSLHKECSQLLALLDTALRKPQDILAVSEEDGRYWLEWVRKFRTWEQLNRAIRSLILGSVGALRELQEQDRLEEHWAQQAIHFIEQSGNPNLNLDEVARRVGVHPVTLSRMFKQHAGINFAGYMTRHRMRLAQQLLLNTNKTARAIAAEVGYADYPYFRAIFKKESGSSPSEWRKR